MSERIEKDVRKSPYVVCAERALAEVAVALGQSLAFQTAGGIPPDLDDRVIHAFSAPIITVVFIQGAASSDQWLNQLRSFGTLHITAWKHVSDPSKVKFDCENRTDLMVIVCPSDKFHELLEEFKSKKRIGTVHVTADIRHFSGFYDAWRLARMASHRSI